MSENLNKKTQPGTPSKHRQLFAMWQGHTDTWVLIICLAIGLCAAVPLWGPGIVNTRGGGDSPFLLQRTLEMAENIKHGLFPPRWMHHAAYEYGYPFFNYYGALPYYISGSLTALGVPVTLAIQATQTLGFVLASLAMALWISDMLHDPRAIIVAAAAYSFAPFHMVNVYIRGDSLSEFYAFIWFPLILWTLNIYARRTTFARLCLVAAAYGGLILTHNTSAVAFSPFAALYALLCNLHNRKFSNKPLWFIRHIITPSIIPFIAGILLTMWFWLPAVTEISYGQLGADFTEGYFHYSQHFRGFNLVQNTPVFDYTIALKAADAGPFSMGLVQTSLTLCGLLTLLLPQKTVVIRWVKHYMLVSLCLATFIMTPLSGFIWSRISLLSITQFPWRFLSVQSVFTAAITANIPLILTKKPPRASQSTRMRHTLPTIITAVIILGLAAAVLLQLKPDRLPINSTAVTWNNLRLYETFTGNIGTTIRHEYLPADVVPRPYITQAVVDDKVSPQLDGTGDLTANLEDRTPGKQTWSIRVGLKSGLDQDKATIVFPLYWWPAWYAFIDGDPADAYPLPGSGQLAMDIAAGTHNVTLLLRSTQTEIFAGAISILTGGFFLAAMIIESHRAHANIRYRMAKWGLWIIVIGAISLVMPVLWAKDYPENGIYFDFTQMPYPHAGPIDFGQASLDYSSLSTGAASPGEVIDVKMRWSLSGMKPLTATLQLVSPAAHRHLVEYTLANMELKINPEMLVSLPLPENLSRGLYLLQLRLYSPSAELMGMTPQGRTMGPLFIGAIRAPRGPELSPNPPQPAAEFEDIRLVNIHANQMRVDQLRLDMQWSTQGTPRNWSLSLRLIDSQGRQIAQRDTQPGYGFLPTSLWQPGELITDHLDIQLPEGLAPGRYTLRIISYLQATMETGGEYDVSIDLTKPTLYDLSKACCELERSGKTIQCQKAGIALLGTHGSEKLTSGENLSFTAEWNAVQQPSGNLSVDWAVLNTNNETVGHLQQALVPGSNTGSWPRHTWVLSPVQLELDPFLPAGSYYLQLTMFGGEQNPVICRLNDIEVAPRPRVYAIPDLRHKQIATFNNEIKFLGYDLIVHRRQSRIQLTLWWQALNYPVANYKRFVHLYDMKSNNVLVQDDAIPRNWSYPTTWWDVGEVVSETIALSLNDLTPGAYFLGIGWYDPDTLVRLPASSDQNSTIEDDRVTLSVPVNLR
ncbi:MAG: hypothetical protein P1S60_01550 [Anaerolineae bacterium]|nr:hypothetical protein [Anaerolineae bacterium]